MAAAVHTEPRLAGGAGTARAATWVAAALATGSLPLHAWMLIAHAHGPILTVLMAAMTLWCWWCAVRAVRASRDPGFSGGTPGDGVAPLRHLWIMAQAMTLIHVALLTGFPGTGGHRHAGGPAGVAPGSGSGSPAGTGTQTSLGGMAEPLLWVVVLELAVCFACAVALRAGRSGTQSALAAAAPPPQPVGVPT
ncbi:hypothetical protein F7P69_04885 [Cellulosimicrobium funkei]|nr:hypothetical protein [Cellulosimicrobium funkei]